MKKILLSFLLPVLFWQSGSAQQGGLSVGDQCPDFWIEKIVDYPKPTARRSDFKTPLLLLQFCTPRCKGCAQTAPVLDSLQTLFAGQLTVLQVTSRSAAEVELGKAQLESRRRFPLPFVVDDTLLHRLFPYALTPHLVWIDAKGLVRAITAFDYVTAPNIRAVLEGKKLDWAQKKEVNDFDHRQPLLVGNEVLNPAPEPLFYTAVTPYLEGVLRKSTIDSAAGFRRLKLVNFSLLELYHNTLKFHPGAVQPKRTVWKVADPSRYSFDPLKGYEDVWKRANYFCYESRLPLALSLEEQWNQMRLDLNRYFNHEARVEKRKVKCWVLVRRKKGETWPQGKEGKDHPDVWWLNNLVAHLDLQPHLPPVIDETGLPGDTPLLMKDGVESTEAVKASLRRYGLELMEKEREREFFVVEEKKGI
ncbi:MAG TPA: hypothetical protein VGN63_16930 [Flavisolibacter sp.]|nr:hypothetical protein [Flavisolibacter sp.]